VANGPTSEGRDLCDREAGINDNYGAILLVPLFGIEHHIGSLTPVIVVVLLLSNIEQQMACRAALSSRLSREFAQDVQS
jgi:hypothetical protein